MTHEQYNVLLDAWLEGTLSKEEETELLIYESEHPECTKQREALSDLQQELSQLGGEIPPVPADFHPIRSTITPSPAGRIGSPSIPIPAPPWCSPTRIPA